MSEEAACAPEESMEEAEELTVHPGDTYPCRRKDGTYRDAEVVKIRMNKRSGKEEYHVRYVGSSKLEMEWVDKTRLVLSKPAKDEEDAENGTPQKISDHEEDEPKSKKVKIDDDRTCLLCGEISKDPVVVECGHPFCRSCINKDSGSQDSFSCPNCENISKSRTGPLLTNLRKTNSGVTAIPTVKQVKAPPLVNCPDHDEKIKLVCKDDGGMCCVICRDALKHIGHKFMPVDDAVMIFREELAAQLSPLENALKDVGELSSQQSKKVENLKNTVTEYRQHIVSKFSTLNSFLMERKKSLLEDLKEKSEHLLAEMVPNAAKLERNRDAMKEAVCVARRRMDETDPVPFLQGIHDFMNMCREQQEAVSGNRIIQPCRQYRGTFKGPIQYFAWKQMKSVVEVPKHLEEDSVPKQPTIAEEIPDIPKCLVEDSVPQQQQPITQKLPIVQKSLVKDSVPKKTQPIKKMQPINKKIPGIPKCIKDDSDPKDIWMVGDLFMNAVNIRAEKGPLGRNLGFEKQTCNLLWLGIGNYCPGLLPRLIESRSKQKKPAIIFFHVGSDMGRPDFPSLVDSVRRDLSQVAELYPNVVVMLSTLLPQEGLEQQRRTFNSMLEELVGRPTFYLLEYHELATCLTQRYAAGVQTPLTDKEIDLFLSDIRDALKILICQASIPRFEQPVLPPSTAVKNEGNAEVVSTVTDTKEIWMIGDKFMNAVNRRAEKSPLGRNLGFDKQTCTLLWLGLGKYISSLFFKLIESRSNVKRPDVIFCYIGSDLGSSDMNLIPTVKGDLMCLRQLYPSTVVVMSTLLPQAEWQGEAMEQQRNEFNSMLTELARKPLFYLLTHHELEKKLTERFTAKDLSALTEAEIDLFLTSVRDALQKTMSQSRPSDKCCPPPSIKQNASSAPAHEETESDAKVESNATTPKQIWLIGTDLDMDKAMQRARTGPLGLNLGFPNQTCKLRWRTKGRSWSDIFFFLKQQSLIGKMPDIILFHSGDSELEGSYLTDLLHSSNCCLNAAARFFPNSIFFLSTLLPKPQGRKKGKSDRKAFNYSLMQRTHVSQFQLLEHNQLETNLLQRYQKGDHRTLTNDEIDHFLTDIVEALKLAVGKRLLSSMYSEDLAIRDLPVAAVKSVAPASGPDPPATKDKVESAVTGSVQQPTPVERKESPSSTVGNPARAERIKFPSGEKEIWIVGCKNIISLHDYAIRQNYVANFGFDGKHWRVRWPVSFDQWSGLSTFLNDMSSQWGIPSIIFLQLGDKDLREKPCDELLLCITSELKQLADMFPNTQFIFSTILPSPDWLGVAMEESRKFLNRNVGAFSEQLGFEVASNQKLEEVLLKRFQKGKLVASLTDSEDCIFYASIKEALEKVIKDYKPINPTPQKQVLSTGESLNVVVPGTNQASSSENKAETKAPGCKQPVTSAAVQRGHNDHPAETPTTNTTRPKDIWLIGSDLDEAKQRAETGPLGLNLGFPNQTCVLRWWSENQSWSDIYFFLKHQSLSGKRPDAILFHSGDAELVGSHLTDLMQSSTGCLKAAARFFPNTTFFLSTLLPQPNFGSIEYCRRAFNNSLMKHAERLHFQLLRHDELEKNLKERYRKKKRSSLTNDEIDHFLTDIVEALKQAVEKRVPSTFSEELTIRDLPVAAVKSVAPAGGPDPPPTKDKVESAVTGTVGKLARAERIKFPPGEKEIWIVGCTYIILVHYYAKHQNNAENFGFDEKHWRVRWPVKFDQWSGLSTFLNNISSLWGIPSIVFLHLGDKELREKPCDELMLCITSELKQLAEQFPNTQFIFSTILPSADWLGTAMEESRQLLNRTVGAFAEQLGFDVASNQKLEEELLKRFQKGQLFASLSPSEDCIFYASIKESLEKVMKDYKPINPTPQKQVLSTGKTLTVVIPGANQVSSSEDKAETRDSDSSPSPSVITKTVAVEKATLECKQPVTSATVQRGHNGHPVDSPGTNTTRVKGIWIIGNSYICRAARLANRSSYGSNLGLESKKWAVHWLGRVSMRWEALLTELKNSLSKLGEPSIVFIHLGDNDVGSMSHDTLIKAIEGNLSQIMKHFPRTEFVLSMILPRGEWLTNSLEQSRKDINTSLARYGEELGFHVATHKDIEERAIPRFKCGGIPTISDSEYDLFMKQIKDCVGMMVLKVENEQTV